MTSPDPQKEAPSPRAEPPRPRRRYGAVMKFVRRLHMYLGLLVFPWVLLFGASGALFNHPEIGRDIEQRDLSPEELEEIEVGGTRRVVDACVAAGVEHLTVTSSGAAYGYHPRNDGHLLTEDDSTPGSPEFAYSRHKAAVERVVERSRRLHPSLGILLLRPGTIIGAGTDNQITALFTGRVLMTLRETDGPFVFVWDEDVAEVVVEGVLRRRTGTYNVAGDGVMTMRDIAAVEGARLVRVPAGALRRVLTVTSRLGIGRYGPDQVRFLLHRPVLDNTRLRRDFPGLPTRTTREAYEVFRQGRVRG